MDTEALGQCQLTCVNQVLTCCRLCLLALAASGLLARLARRLAHGRRRLSAVVSGSDLRNRALTRSLTTAHATATLKDSEQKQPTAARPVRSVHSRRTERRPMRDAENYHQSPSRRPEHIRTCVRTRANLHARMRRCFPSPLPTQPTIHPPPHPHTRGAVASRWLRRSAARVSRCSIGTTTDRPAVRPSAEREREKERERKSESVRESERERKREK